ncbi:NTE family protein [Bradyrhizobium sp. USDA 4504]
MLNVMREQTHPVAQQTRSLPYDVVALVLQGGGALGAYQAGVYEGLHEAGIRPNWLAGISIGALNAAIIAGAPEEERVERLREFWEIICAQSIEWPAGEGLANALPFAFDIHSIRNALAAMRALVQGQPGFFRPRFPSPLFSPFSGDAATSFYDTAPLHRTLERLVDFDRLNSGEVRVSVGAVNVRTGNLTYFDTAERRLCPKHFMASGALPPGFPAVEIEGEHYWDGGVVSNTPLSRVLSGEPRDTLTFQIDLWSARGRVPYDMMEVSSRQKDIQYSSSHARRHRPGAAHAENASDPAAGDRATARGRKEGSGNPRDRGYGPPSLPQHHPPDLPDQAPRRSFEGLRIRTERDARPLAERVGRHPPHACERTAPRSAPARARHRHPRHPSPRLIVAL